MAVEYVYDGLLGCSTMWSGNLYQTTSHYNPEDSQHDNELLCSIKGGIFLTRLSVVVKTNSAQQNVLNNS
jgi:hypothetical protein